MPACLPVQLLINEGLQKFAKESAIFPERGRGGTQERAKQAGVSDVELWSLGEPVHTVGIPQRQLIKEKTALQKTNSRIAGQHPRFSIVANRKRRTVQMQVYGTAD